jgi:hypothetical protein
METWRHGDMNFETWTWRHGIKKLGNSDVLRKVERKIEAQVICLNLRLLFAHRANGTSSFCPFVGGTSSFCPFVGGTSSFCPFVDEETNGRHPFVNELNGLVHL